MRRSALCLALLLIGLTALCVRADAPPSTQPAINKFCAVHHDNPVDDRVPTVQYQGQTIGFCCPDCIKIFLADPETYMVDLK